MNRCLVLALLLGACTSEPVSEPEQPPVGGGPTATGQTIVLVVADDMRQDQLPILASTLARLETQSVEFTRALAPVPLCCPSRVSILTGQHAHNHGIKTNLGPLGGASRFPGTSTIATWLDAAGWATAHIGKYLNDYDQIAPRVPPGWDHWFVSVGDIGSENYVGYQASRNGAMRSYSQYSTDRFRDEALSWLGSLPATANAFLVLAVEAPHAPRIPAPQDLGTFATQAIVRPPSFNEADVSDKPTWVRSLGSMSASDIAAETADNRAGNETLLAVDRTIVALVDSLVSLGRWGRTLFVFTSDHGLSWGEHRIKSDKQCPYRACVDVPLLVRVPGIAAREDTSLVTLIDLAPTLAAWAGVGAPNADGLDLLPLLAFPSFPWRDAVLIEEWYSNGTSYQPARSFAAVRTHQYLWVEKVDPPGNQLDDELYDYRVDPWELMNRRADPAYNAIKANLRARLAALRAE